jgi:hypothetical protein
MVSFYLLCFKKIYKWLESKLRWSKRNQKCSWWCKFAKSKKSIRTRKRCVENWLSKIRTWKSLAEAAALRDKMSLLQDPMSFEKNSGEALQANMNKIVIYYHSLMQRQRVSHWTRTIWVKCTTITRIRKLIAAKEATMQKVKETLSTLGLKVRTYRRTKRK